MSLNNFNKTQHDTNEKRDYCNITTVYQSNTKKEIQADKKSFLVTPLQNEGYILAFSNLEH